MAGRSRWRGIIQSRCRIETNEMQFYYQFERCQQYRKSWPLQAIQYSRVHHRLAVAVLPRPGAHPAFSAGLRVVEGCENSPAARVSGDIMPGGPYHCGLPPLRGARDCLLARRDGPGNTPSPPSPAEDHAIGTGLVADRRRHLLRHVAYSGAGRSEIPARHETRTFHIYGARVRPGPMESAISGQAQTDTRRSSGVCSI